jgi:hypothetical protein
MRHELLQGVLNLNKQQAAGARCRWCLPGSACLRCCWA